MKRVLAIVILLIFVFGCNQLTKSGSTDESEDEERYEFSGSSGLVVKFQSDKISGSKFKGDEIEIVIDLENKGEYDLGSGEIIARLVGETAQDIFGGNDGEYSTFEDLPKAELGRSVSSFIEMGNIAYSPEMMVDSQKTATLKAEVCYPYHTLVRADEFYIGSDPDEVKKGSLSGSEVSAGPVRVSGFDEAPAVGKVRFWFTLKHSGNGMLVDECFGPEKEVVFVDIERPSGASCETLGGGSSGEIELDYGKKQIICSVPTDESNFKTQFQVDVGYTYQKEIEEKITIKNIETE